VQDDVLLQPEVALFHLCTWRIFLVVIEIFSFPPCFFGCGCSCQTSDWPMHKHLCSEETQRLAANPDFHSLFLLGCELVKTCQRQKSEPSGLKDELVACFRTLPGHIEELRARPDDGKAVNGEETLKGYSHLAEAVVKHLHKIFPAAQGALPTPKELVEDLGRFGCNNFEVHDEELFGFGWGAYPLTSLMNHSCEPNCVIMYEGSHQVLRVIHNVSRGEELCFSYIDVAQPRSERRRLLLDKYFFECWCPRCTDETTYSLDGCLTDGVTPEPDLSSTMEKIHLLGDDERKQASPLPLKISGPLTLGLMKVKGTCGERRDLARSVCRAWEAAISERRLPSNDMTKKVRDAGDLVARIRAAQHEEGPDGVVRSIVEGQVSQLSQCLNPVRSSCYSRLNRALYLLAYNDLLQGTKSHYSLQYLKLCPLLMTRAMDLGQWDVAEEACAHALLVYHLVYPWNHPMITLHLVTLGKIQWNGLKSRFNLTGLPLFPANRT